MMPRTAPIVAKPIVMTSFQAAFSVIAVRHLISAHRGSSGDTCGGAAIGGADIKDANVGRNFESMSPDFMLTIIGRFWGENMRKPSLKSASIAGRLLSSKPKT